MTNEPERSGEPADIEPGVPAMPNTEQAPPPPPPSEPGRPKRLTRSRHDDWFGGVAGGLAEYFDVDPTLVRIAFVVAAILTSGFAIIGYIVAWIVIPEAGSDEAVAHRRPRREMGGILWGGILVIAGTLFLLAQLDLDIDFPSWDVGLSAALIFVGLLMLVEARNGFNAGLMTLAVVLTVLLGLSSVSSFNFVVDGAFGDSRHVVTQPGELESDYSHAFGSLVLDLSDFDPAEGTTHVEISMVFGDALLTLPDGVPYRIEADSVFGSINGPAFDTEGIATSRTYTSPGYSEASERISIEMSVVFGSGRIR